MSLTFYTATGNFKVELYITKQDSHILENFIRHVAKGSYENNRILRFVPEFILQTGSPNNRSKYSIEADSEHPLDATINQEVIGKKEVKRGTLFTINNEDNVGSQFFILLNTKYADQLDQGNYAAIGEIIDGWNAIEQIESDIEVVDHPSSKPVGKWKNKAWIEIIEIHNNPFVPS